jgi:RimJ/RimL family protein N-acetyltransferase
LVGSAGFHDFPDQNGMIEIGFGIVPERQNRGFGRELLSGMWKMISSREDVKILRYTVSPDNKPSLHIIKKLGFIHKGEQVDEEDGVELIF